MRRLNIYSVVLAVLIVISFFIFIIETSGIFFRKHESKHSLGDIKEHFDSSLIRLKSISEFVTYCDSLYGDKQIATQDSEKYASIVSRTLRDRFYHGYSYYSLGNNTLGYLLAPLIKSDLNAVVIPDDILKYPMAACSQQSIIGMEVFKSKGLSVRKVGFSTIDYGGHFCYEVFFNNTWHFFDPDLEPKLSSMIANHFPSIADIVKNDSLLHLLYYKRDSTLVENLFPSYQYGPINKFPAPHAIIYQYATKYLSYTSWILFILLYFINQKMRLRFARRKKLSKQQDQPTVFLRA